MAALTRQGDFILAVVLMILVTNITGLLSSPTLVGDNISFLDHSWQFDLVTKTRQHVWLGDQVIFTYGPLFQVASSFAPNLFRGTLGAFFRSSHLLPFWSLIIFTFLTGRILLGGHSAWKRGFYLLALVGFWGLLDVRFCFDFFVFAIALHHFDRVRQTRAANTWAALGLALLVLAGFFISADTGIYSLAALVISAVVHLYLYRAEKPLQSALLRSLALSAIFLGFLFVLAAVLFRGPGFGYWADSAAIVNQYRWSMAYRMDRPVKWRMVSTIAFTTLTLLLGYRWRDPLSSSLSRRPAFFPAAILFSLLALQSALVRSDWGHVGIALLPAIAFAGAVLMGSEVRVPWSWRGDLPMLVALGLTAAFSGPTPPLAPQNIAAGLRLGSITRSETCPSGTNYLDDACIDAAAYERLQKVSGYLRRHTTDIDTVAIFPFENIYADMANRRVAGGVLQNYVVAGERLVRRQLQGFDRDRPKAAIFSADGLASFPVDEVPNFTRAPQVWLYLQNHFRSRQEIAPGILALERDDTRAQRARIETISLAGASQTTVQHKKPVDLPLTIWPVLGDFLKVRLIVHYPPWWKLRKPSSIRVKVGHADGTDKVFRAVLPPNLPADLWIYPWDESQLLSYFEPNEDAWRRPRPRAPVTQLQVTFERMDGLSVVPSSASVESIEAVRLRLQ